MPPLAGKPPFATDEPDSFYESSPPPQRRIRQPAPPDPNARTSAYNVYDSYLGPDSTNTNHTATRQSGVGALGMGLLNMSDSEDDSDDEDSHKKSHHAPSKNAALAAATGVTSRSPPPRSSSKNVMNSDTRQMEPPTIAAPRPGYAAPIAALNLARPEPAKARAPPPRPIGIPTLENPFDPPMAQPYNAYRNLMPNSPSPSVPPSTPHPLQPPITPITPVFARPAKPGAITFSGATPRTRPVMRGGTEDALLPRRGEKGDDFWRRFSMVAKIENRNGSKESWWLKKTQSGTTRLSRWVWVIAIVLVLCIVAASVLGWKLSQNNSGDDAPTAFGGSANERPSSLTTTNAPEATGTSSSIKHVSPTHTVARREAPDVTPTARPLGHIRAIQRRRLFDAIIAH